jgi:hypothetical protein
MKKEMNDMLKRLLFLFLVAALWACNKKDDEIEIPTSGDTYEVKNYKIIRHPPILRLGCGMDFVHDSTTRDTFYFDGVKNYAYDVMLYNQMAYYQNSTGDWLSVGNPVVFMYIDTLHPENSVKACRIGTGTTFFDSIQSVPRNMLDSLKADSPIDFSTLQNSMGYYDRDKSLAAFDKLVIGNKWRTLVLTIPDDKTEQDMQPVFLVETREGMYAKFMCTQFKCDGAYQMYSNFRWQVFKN